jgi:hypothetical protein
VENFGGHAHGLTEAVGADGHYHELLEIHRIVGVGSAVDDVGHGNRQQSGVVGAEVFEQGLAEEICCGPGGGQGYAEDGVGAQLALVLGAVELDHGAVYLHLIQGVQAFDFTGDDVVHVFYGFQNAFAHVTAFVAVTKFHGFVFAGGCAAGNCGTAETAVFEDYVNFNGGVSPGVEDFAGLNVFDQTHTMLLLCVIFAVPVTMNRRNCGPAGVDLTAG